MPYFDSQDVSYKHRKESGFYHKFNRNHLRTAERWSCYWRYFIYGNCILFNCRNKLRFWFLWESFSITIFPLSRFWFQG